MALAWVTLDALNPTGFNQKYPDLRADKAAHQDIRASFSALDQLLAVATQRAALGIASATWVGVYDSNSFMASARAWCC